MKLETKNGIAIVTSTNAKEYRALVELSLGNFSEKKPSKQTKKDNSKYNPWKGKHKKKCVHCDLVCKNMLKHTRSAHAGEEVLVEFTNYPRKEKKVDAFDAVTLSPTDNL